MEVHGYFTEGYNNHCYPVKATNYPSLKAAMADLEKRWGDSLVGNPFPVGYIYRGKADGDEEKLGYPEYPDYLLKVGRRGGFVCRRIH